MGTFQSATGKSIDIAFAEFHKKNPLVWKTFEAECFKAIRYGRVKISAKQLIGHIRWYVSLQTTDEKFKINDAFTSRYARMFAKKYPRYTYLFEYRDLRSGAETIVRELVNKYQQSILKKCNIGKIVKLGTATQVHYMKEKVEQISRSEFNYLVKIKMIYCTNPESRTQIFKTTNRAKKWIKDHKNKV